MFNMKKKDTVSLALAAGALVLTVGFHVLCSDAVKCPERKFIEGGREMLSSIPGIASNCCSRIVKSVRG